MKGRTRVTLWAVIAASAAMVEGCGSSQQATVASEPRSGLVGSDSDAALAECRRELLDAAFETASAIPLVPFIKDRSRAQALVVSTCLEIGEAGLALSYDERIENWLRGDGYAEIAFHEVQEGNIERARELLASAEHVAGTTEDWRRDRILAKIARARALLGEQDAADRYEAGVVPAESGRVAAVRARQADADGVRAELAKVAEIAKAGGFDETRAALDVCVAAFGNMYRDAALREEILATVRASWIKVPTTARIEILANLARQAIEHGDQGTALELVDSAQVLLDGLRLLPEDRVPEMARLAAVRFAAGDVAKARTDADAALALYRSERERIVDVFRAAALRPLAEAYRAMEEIQAAVATYQLALEDGGLNPNARPRAEDLSATCCSMARVGVEPDAAGWAKIHALRRGLGEPW